MPFKSIEQGIQAIKAGKPEEGARLLKYALEDEMVTGSIRAVALVALATTVSSPQEKKAYYNQALAADPENKDARLHLSQLLAADLGEHIQKTQSSQGGIGVMQPQMPNSNTQTPTGAFPALNPPQNLATQTPTGAYPVVPAGPGEYLPPRLPTDTQPMQLPLHSYMPPPTPLDSRPLMPQQQIAAPDFYRTVGIVGGPNGRGTGCFVTRDGLIATTRFVTGGAENLTVELTAAQHLPGRVVRSFPDLDLAFVRVGISVGQLLTISNSPVIAENTPIAVITHNGGVISGMRRRTTHQMAGHWFATTIKALEDAGGCPVFDANNYLVGMMTRNSSRDTGHLFGLHITMIYKFVEHYLNEIRISANRMYCPSCGYVSRAGDFRAFYCENCGGVLPYARNAQRFSMSPQTDPLYNENMYGACTNCQSRIGYYNGACLRCGHRIVRS